MALEVLNLGSLSAGIGKLAGAALEGIARQPEAAGNLRTTMLIAAAFVEGVSLFAVVVCFLAIGQ
jgi:F-type H+-transporting ATPase subunit c